MVALIGALLLSASVVVSLAASHVDDGYRINHVAGAWLALTKYADDGVLYPPLFDEQTGRYGGTRFMPGRIGLNLAASKLTGEYLTSAKVVSLAAAIALFITMVVVLRRRSCPMLSALAFAMIPFMTDPGHWAFASTRGDTLPVVFQLIAIMFLFGRSVRTPHVLFAALFSTLAVLFKLSALWAGGAIGLWLLVKDRRQFALFCAGSIALQALMWGALYALSDGRVIENLLNLAASEVSASGLAVYSPVRMIRILAEQPAAWLLIPFAAVNLIRAIGERRLDVLDLALLLAIGSTWFILAGVGTAENHVLDVIVLFTLIAGETSRYTRQDHTGEILNVLAMIAIALGLVGGTMEEYRFDVQKMYRASMNTQQTGPALNPLEKRLSADATILTDDPGLEVARGRLPVMLDAFMLRRIYAMRPDDVQPLIERIRQQEFDAIVLIEKLDPTSSWYASRHFGRDISETIDQTYVLNEDVIDGYWIYRPRTANNTQ